MKFMQCGHLLSFRTELCCIKRFVSESDFIMSSEAKYLIKVTADGRN